MALDDTQEVYIPRDSNFYRDHFHHVIVGLMILIFTLTIALAVVFYQMANRPLPQFYAVQPNGQRMFLIPYDEPNLLPSTILQWASKAATIAYTFDFVNYNSQIAAARPYFTDDGWQDYVGSVNSLISNIVQAKLFINGIVAGTPVISNQGPLPDKGYAWRIQIPFLVTYQSANELAKRQFYVIITVVRVPTSVNKAGIGIDQFVMTQR